MQDKGVKNEIKKNCPLVQGIKEIHEGERTQHGTNRQSFRKVDGDDNAVFFQNVETGETVLDMPNAKGW